MLKCFKRTPSQPSNVQNAARDTTCATLISECSKGRPSGSLMPRGAPSKACYSYFATPAGTGIDVRRNILPTVTISLARPPSLARHRLGLPHLGPILGPNSKFGSKFGPRGQNWAPNPNLGLVWPSEAPWGPGCPLIDSVKLNSWSSIPSMDTCCAH